MGIKKFFKIKPPEEATPEVNRDELNELGIPVKNVNRKKKEKFAAYGTFAKDKGKDKFFAPPGYEKYAQQNEDDLDDLNKSDVDPAPEDPYLSAPSRNDFDPYARNNFGNSGGSSDPYNKGSAYGASGSPYANVASDPYSQQSNPYGNTGGSVSGPQDSGPSRYSNRGNPYDQASNGRGSDPYQGANGITGSGSNDSSVDARWNPYGNNAESTERGAYAPSRSRSRNQNNEQNPKMNGGYNSSRSSPTGNPYGDAPYGSRGNTTSPTPSNAGNNRYGPTSGASSYIARQPSTGVSAKVPYGSTGPYGSSQDVPSGDAYGGNAASKSSNPYSTLRNDPYGGSLNQSTGGSAGVAYNNTSNRANLQPEPTNNADSFDFEAPSQVDDFTGVANDDDIDLNATLQEGGDDLNQSIYEGYGGRMQQQQQQVQPPQADQMHHEANRGYQTFDDVQRESQMRQQQEEDEEVDEVKQQIRFTKQSSVASTRNTLKMAQEAEAAGMNTLGMLGHQSEKLNNVERNLDLMKMQNRVAEDKVAELKKLNRNILAVHVSNPFNSKRRLREAEDKIKMQRVEDKMMQQQTNSELQQSTQRIEGAMMGAGNHTETVRERYQNKAIIDKAKRYQFENDEEDDEMELEIDKNLDKIGQVSSRLKKLALASGNEIDAQQDRVKDIEEDTDNLDIKIHLNTTRLTQIR